jgi:TonB-dependent receptor
MGVFPVRSALVHRNIRRISGLAVAVTGVLSSAAAFSEDATHRGVDALQEVVVLAQRVTEEIAREAQQQAPNLINLMTAAEMARLPDVNTGEAIRRVPGISLETDTGEGRYVNIRGLDADLNSTTFGGLRLPPTNTSSPSGAGRAVAFDSIPVGFVGAITVTKSNLPEQDAEALGGTIDITPKTAPSDGKPFLELKLGGGEELQRHTGISDFAFTTGTRFGGDGGYQPFSILLTGSIYNDGRGIDDAEAGFFDEQPGVPDKAISALEQRYYQYHRRRHGYGADLGYDPDADNHYFVRYYDSGYTEYKYRQMLQWNFTDPSGASGVVLTNPANANGFVAPVDSLKVKVQDEQETLTQRVAEIGGKNKIGDNTLDYHVGYTKGSYYMPLNYQYSFKNTGLNTAAYDNTTNANWPTIGVVDPAGFNPLDAAGYNLAGKMTNGTQDINDHEWALGVNLAIPTHFTDRADEQFKVGLNARLREKTGDTASYSIAVGSAVGDAASIPLTAAINGGPVSYYKGNYTIPALASAGYLRDYYQQNIALQSAADPIAIALSTVNDKEDVYAAYGQYQFGYGPLGIIAGLRIEQTQATYAAFKQDSTGVSCPADQVCPVSTNRSYTNFFPTAQARYEFSPDLIGRLAISSTIARPGFEQITATSVIDSNGNVTTGNPNLKPTTATGLDIAIENYLAHGGIASLGFFVKDIKDYIVTDSVPLGGQVSGGNLGIAKLFSFTNGAPAHVYGFEVAFVKKFKDDLPGALGGLGVAANWTWVDSWYEVPVLDSNGNSTLSRVSILPSTSRNTANAELLYEMYGLNLSLGAYYTSRNIFSTGPSAATDVWTQDRVSLDFGSQYKVTDQVSAYFNLKNLTNTALKFTEGEGENRVIQREMYGLTVQAGINIKF